MDKKYIMCTDCVHCKIKNDKISCKKGMFEDLTFREACLLTPFDFDCYKWEEG